MSVEQFPDVGYFIVASNTTVPLGSYELPADGDLLLAHMRVFHKKTGAYSYTMKLEVSTTETGPALVTSDVETFSNAVTGQTTGNWLGDLTFSFPEYALFSGETYHFRLILTGYTRGTDPAEDFLAVWCDWLEPIGVANTVGARLALGVAR